MALVVKDRVQETTTTAGTGTLTLGGAVLGFQTFAVIGNANQTYYAISDPTTGDFEVGIGTYTASGTTLSRTTVLESSNSNSLVSFAAGSKNVFCTYPAERAVYLDTAGSAVTLLDIGTLGVGTANITTANITSGTVSTAPVNNTDIVNKEYADAIASGIHFHEAVDLATTTALPANTYNNGASGVGATLTATANGALSVDSTLTVVTNRILVKNQAAQSNNGVYTVTQVGSAGTPYILTRATDFNTAGTGVNQIDEGDFFLVTSGTVNLNTAWVQQTAPPIVVGTTALVFQQFAAPITYTAGTGLSESPTYTFNIANTGTAGTYGGAASVPVFTTNAQGQVTSVTNTGIAIAAGAVSGLAASATTDTTNASNISSGTLGTSRLSGSYTGVTGVGTLAAGTWNATTIAAARGGTGLTSYAVGDLVYADTTTSLAKLADVAVGNALISGGVGAAPSYGKIGLATHVSGTLPIANGGTGTTSTTFANLTTNVTGTLPVANGGTGAATFTANNVLLGNGTSAFQVVAPGTNGNVLQSNGTTWVSATAPSTMVYPGAGIPNSTGTSWGTSYSTSGSGTVVALATSPSLTTPTIGGAGATFSGSTSGTTVFRAAAAAGTTTITMPATTGTMALTSDIPTVNNATLTLAVSGTGLSGSQTFTANQSTAATFTVTSNATNANTASTIVARDASGNFSAGTITAALSGNATTATSATSATTATNQSGGTVSATTGAFSSTITSSFAPAAINTTTPGLTNYGIAFSGSSSTDNAQGITWGWSGTPAQAGIYVQSSGSYGTKMYLATTDNFATGAKSAISIDHTGAVNILRSSLTVNGTVSLGGSLKRTAAGQGYLNGDYSSAESISTTGVIYSIGGVYVPTSTSYNNMYGVAYAFSGPGRPMGNVAGIPSDQWAFVGLEAGTPKWALCTSNGSAYFSGGVTATTVNGFTPTASIVGNRLVATDGNGYIFNNYFNSTDNSQAGSVSAVMVKAGDNYLRSGTAAAVAEFVATQNLGIGAGQTWQDVSGSRANGTSYQNTTGRPIMVSFGNSLGGSGGSYVQASVNNSSWINVGREVGGSTYPNQFIVPNNWYYRTAVVGAGRFWWSELR